MSFRIVLRTAAWLSAAALITTSVAQTSETPPKTPQAQPNATPTTGPTGTVAPPNVSPGKPITALSTPEAKIRLLLSAYDGFPTAADLLNVSEGAPLILMRIAEDEDTKPSIRNRAIDALGYFDTPEVLAFLTNILDNQNNMNDMAVHKAITALMKTQGDKGLVVVSPFLAHSDTQLRITTVVAIGTFGGRGGQILLEERSKIEPSDVVKDKIKNFL